jgi:hypothetical protein
MLLVLPLISGCPGERMAKPMSDADQQTTSARLAELEQRAQELQAAANAYLDSTALSVKNEPIAEEVKFAYGTCVILRNYVFFTEMHGAKSFAHNLKLMRNSAREYDSLCVPLDTPVIGGERGSAEYEGELAAARVQYVATQRMREAREEFSKELQSASTEIVNLLHKSIEK